MGFNEGVWWKQTNTLIILNITLRLPAASQHLFHELFTHTITLNENSWCEWTAVVDVLRFRRCQFLSFVINGSLSSFFTKLLRWDRTRCVSTTHRGLLSSYLISESMTPRCVEPCTCTCLNEGVSWKPVTHWYFLQNSVTVTRWIARYPQRPFTPS